MQPDSELCDLTDPLLLLWNRRPHKLLKLLVENRDGVRAAALGGKLPNTGDGGTRLLTPELILLPQDNKRSDTLCDSNSKCLSRDEEEGWVRGVPHLLHGLLQSASHLQRFLMVTDTSLKISHLSLQFVDAVLCLSGHAPVLDL